MTLEWRMDTEPLPQTLMEQLARVAEACVQEEGLTGKLQAFVWLTDEAGIRVVNREQRGLDTATDVLSFPAAKFPGGTARDFPQRLRRLLDPDSGCAHLGDIIIAVPRAQAQAEEYGHSFEREMGYLLAHGLCHLMGYDHLNESDKADMRRLEEAALARAAQMEEQTDE